jgi:hypothetical protein
MQLEQLTSGDGDDGTKERSADVKEDVATCIASSAIEEQPTNEQIEDAKRQKAIQKKTPKEKRTTPKGTRPRKTNQRRKFQCGSKSSTNGNRGVTKIVPASTKVGHARSGSRWQLSV